MGNKASKPGSDLVHTKFVKAGQKDLKETGRFHDKRKLTQDYEVKKAENAEVLGTGYNGAVSVCIDKTSGERCALKTCAKLAKAAGLSTDDHKRLLKNECEIFLHLDHPNIARLRDIYEEQEGCTS